MNAWFVCTEQASLAYSYVGIDSVSLVPSPTPSFSSLAVRLYCTASDEKAGRGTGNKAEIQCDNNVPACVCYYAGLYVLLFRSTTDWSLGKPSLSTTDGSYTPGLPSRPMAERGICRYMQDICRYMHVIYCVG